MEIGISSILNLKKSISDILSYAKINGFDFVNIFLVEPQISLKISYRQINKIKHEASKLGIGINLKSPSFTQNIASLDDEIGELALRQLIKSIEIAHLLDSDTLIIRAGMLFYPERLNVNEAIRRTNRRLSSLLHYSEEYNVKILVENYPYEFDLVRTVSDAEALRKSLGNVHFAMNVTHLYALMKHSEPKILSKAISDLAIIGPPPSPYHLPYNLHELVDVLRFFRKTVRNSPKKLIIATVREDLVMRIRNMLCDVL